MRSAARAEESGPQVARVVERQLRWFWRFVTMPVLFGLVGATVNFAVVDRAIISRACAIIIAGMVTNLSLLCMTLLSSRCGLHQAQQLPRSR